MTRDGSTHQLLPDVRKPCTALPVLERCTVRSGVSRPASTGRRAKRGRKELIAVALAPPLADPIEAAGLVMRNVNRERKLPQA